MPGLRRCPWSQVTPETWEVLSWWSQWRALKVLPYGGMDIMDQPAFVCEGIQTCENIRIEVETGHARQQEKEAQRQIKKHERMASRVPKRK